jgi:hypothetical protein
MCTWTAFMSQLCRARRELVIKASRDIKRTNSRPAKELRHEGSPGTHLEALPDGLCSPRLSLVGAMTIRAFSYSIIEHLLTVVYSKVAPLLTLPNFYRTI